MTIKQEPTPVEAWKCPHCGFVSRYKGNVRRHMTRCYRDPGNRACYTCAHFWRPEYEDEHPWCEQRECTLGWQEDMYYQLHCPMWESEEDE